VVGLLLPLGINTIAIATEKEERMDDLGERLARFKKQVRMAAGKEDNYAEMLWFQRLHQLLEDLEKERNGKHF
jgi:hypothetical protein